MPKKRVPPDKYQPALSAHFKDKINSSDNRIPQPWLQASTQPQSQAPVYDHLPANINPITSGAALQKIILCKSKEKDHPSMPRIHPSIPSHPPAINPVSASQSTTNHQLSQRSSPEKSLAPPHQVPLQITQAPLPPAKRKYDESHKEVALTAPSIAQEASQQFADKRRKEREETTKKVTTGEKHVQKKRRKQELPPTPENETPVEKPSSEDPFDIDIEFEKSTGAYLAANIERLLKVKSDLHPPKFRFDICDEAAEFNFKLLKERKFDLASLLNPTERCITSYGSEFQDVEELDPLFCNHPRWPALRHHLLHGCHYPVEEQDEETRIKDLDANIARGNHKSAGKKEKVLSDAMAKEVQKGWCLLLPADKIKEIPEAELEPLGVATRKGITETGEYIDKDRVTHDCSHEGEFSGQSLNSRIKEEELEPIMFGYCLSRIFHYIVNLRRRYPNKVIWLRKEDFKSAYRRMHLDAKTAKRVAIMVKINGKEYLLLTLRHPFGGKPGPSQFCLFSDIVVDTINDLLASEHWDEKTVYSDFIKNIPTPEFYPANIPFAQAAELIVTLPDEDQGKCDGYIDDLITACVNIGSNLCRGMAAPCTVIHAIAHQASSDTFITRDNMIALDKCIAEGAPKEVQVCLGWTMDTRKLLVSLRFHKFKAWDGEIEQVLERSSISHEGLKSIIGKLENVILIVKMGGHFMNHLYALEMRTDGKSHNFRINVGVKEDLKLHRKFLSYAHAGISMNLLTFRAPTTTIIGDASEHGLGAFNLESGRGWAWQIPEDLQGRAHINLLEFLSQFIQIWIDIIEGRIRKESCVLGTGDNTSSLGWLRRSNFRQRDEDDTDWFVKQQVARKLAFLILQVEAMLYTQWFAGRFNICTDSLSRDCHLLSPSSHELFLKTHAPKQTPVNLSIKPVPKEIVSFVTSILRQLPVKKQRFKKQKPSELLHGVAGTLSCSPSDLERHFISKECLNSKGTSSSPPLRKLLENAPSPNEIKNIWLKEQSTPPSHMYHRPSGQTLGTTPDWTQTVRLASSCKNNGEDTRTKTRIGRSRKPSQPLSSGRCTK